MRNGYNWDMVIHVAELSKNYSVYHKQPGFMGSVKSLFFRKYEHVHAVKDVSFDIDEGEVVGFIGPNGAGKTTTLKCLSGLLLPTSGEVSVLGYTPFDRKPAFLKQIALIMGAKNQLWWDLPAQETFLFNKEIYGVSTEEYKKTLGQLTEILGIQKLLDVQVRKLSLGERMKMELVAALIHSPHVLFMDEPTIGLDVVMQKQLRDFVKQYNESNHATVILTSHYMEDVKQLAKRIIVIDHGALIYDGSLTNLLKKYTKFKELKIVFESEVSLEKLRLIGEITSYEFPKCTIRIPRKETSERAAALLKQFPIDDINIEEPDMEDVIRDIFNHTSSI